MLKIEIFLRLLLGIAWLASEGSGIVKASDAVHLSNEVHTASKWEGNALKRLTIPSKFTNCALADVAITFNETSVRVAEWNEEDSNCIYQVNIWWLNWNTRSRTFETENRSTPWLRNLVAFRNYLPPVKDKCNVIKLEVCKTDHASNECICGVWTPAVPRMTNMRVWKKDDSYFVNWKMEPTYIEQYSIVHKEKEVNTSNPFVLLKNVSPCQWHRFEVRALTKNHVIVRKDVQFLAYPEVYSISKCAVNIFAMNVKAKMGLEVRDPTGFTIASGVDINQKTLTRFNECSARNVWDVSAFCGDGTATRTSRKDLTKTISAARLKCEGPLCAMPPICPMRASSSVDDTVSPKLIDAVRDLSANTDLDRTVILTWRPPKEDNDCIKEYIITWASESDTIDVSNTSYRVTNLEPCMAYNFTVNTIDQGNDKGTPAMVSATVRELQQLSEVTELELYEVEPRSLSVKWKPPSNGTFCVESYRVAAWYNAPDTGAAVTVFSNTTNDQHVTFGEVIACMSYTVQVIPISFQNKDGRNEIGALKTKERTILSYHVEPIRAVTVKSRSLRLSTQLLSENNNNCLLVSVRFNCTRVVEGEIDTGSQIVREFIIQSANVSFEGIVEPLMPFSTYQCNAQIQNIAGWSEPTPAYEFQTAEDVPESPRVLHLVGGNRSIVTSWKAPTVKNGVVVRYRIHVRMIAPEYPIPKVCDPLEEYNETVDLRDEVDPDDTRSWDGAEFEYTISKLSPFTLYTLQVAAATGAGVGPYTEPLEVVTLPDVPEAAQNLRVAEIEGPRLDEPYRSSVTFSWELPCRLHGNLTGFIGRMNGLRDQNEAHLLSWNVNVDTNQVLNGTYFFTEDRLMPEYNYTVSMSVEVATIIERSQEAVVLFQSPAGIPSIDHTEEWFEVNVLDAPNPTNTARIVVGNITLASDIGSIRYLALLISERVCQPDPLPRTDFITGIAQWPEVPDWHRVNNMRCVEQYQTTPKFWNPMGQASRSVAPIEYVVGKDSCDNGIEYCNGPLRPGTEYALIVRIFSSSGFADSGVQVFRTDSLIQVGLIVSTIVASLLLAFIGGLLLFWRKQRLLLPAQLSGRTPTEEPSDIPLKNFPNQYDELFQSNRDKVSKEFQAINYFSDFVLHETVSFVSARENERKNRYVNILPFDSNRVLLDTDEDDESNANDYINASFIEGYKYQREYIATQGPKQDTCYDFWRMVLQYEIESIVMLTQPIDHDKNKCCQYYPRFDQYVVYGDIRVKCTQEMNLSLYYKRLFMVSKGNQSKAVFHYHFLEWPDHSCPSSMADLIKFSKIIRAERKSYAIPLVVHCSAGVGRTGTFIALDIILQRMHQEKKINVYDTVKRLRRQRTKMVQTLDQYAFLYQCCLEYVSRTHRKKPKTSSVEVPVRNDSEKQHPEMIVEADKVAVNNGGKPMFNIKFPKSVNSGLGQVTSFAPNDIER